MSKLTGLKDIDREVLKHVDDRELLKVCTMDRRMWNDVCDDSFLKRRMGKYHGIEKYKKDNESWKQFFLRSLYYILKMREEYQFDYFEGDFIKQYYILKKSSSLNFLLVRAAEMKELSLVNYALEKGANIHFNNDQALRLGSSVGDLNIVKYLIEKGANPHIDNDFPFFIALYSGYLYILKILIESGIIILTPASYERALKYAKYYNQLEVADYLEKLKEKF